jgi:NAD(P)-dependent dehydrogenase (short-subunit alcohol dehydrogenase family)
MAKRLEGKVAIVTGAAEGGIGAAYARGLAEAGAAVVVTDIKEDGVAATAATLTAEGHAVRATVLDVTDEESIRTAVDMTVAEFGGLDILVNNAGLYSEVPRVGLIEAPLALYDLVHRVNVLGPLLCARAAVPHMRARGGGKIINQASAAAFLPGSRSLYRLSKHALVGLTASLAVELGKENINVNAIAPGQIASEASLRAVGPVGDPKRHSLDAVIPNPEPDRPPSVLVGTLLLLASAEGDYINGQTINVDGGWVIRL